MTVVTTSTASTTFPRRGFAPATPLMENIRRVLLRLSGVDRDVLVRCPAEETKFLCMGGAVLTTAGLASVAMGYALHVGLHLPWILAMLGAPLWGFAMANAELLLVSSARRQKSALLTFTAALPRLILAGLSGAVISVFLILQLFASSIAAEIPSIQAAEKAAFQQQLTNDPQLAKIPALQTEVQQLQTATAAGVTVDVSTVPAIARLQAQVGAAQHNYFQAQQSLTCEVAGTCADHHAGEGPVYQQKNAIVDQRKAIYDSLRAQLARAEATARPSLLKAGSRQLALDRETLSHDVPLLNGLLAKRAAEVSAEQHFVSDDGGLLMRLEALDKLGKDQPVVNLWRWLIAALLMALECLPVLTKIQMLMGKKSLYEQIQEKDEESRVKGASLLLGGDRALQQVKLDAARQQAELEHDGELKAMKMELDAKHAAQKTINDRLIEIWLQRRMSEIEDDPDQFLA